MFSLFTTLLQKSALFGTSFANFTKYEPGVKNIMLFYFNYFLCARWSAERKFAVYTRRP